MILPDRDLPSQQEADLKGIQDACYDILTDLEKFLNKYQELDAANPGNDGKLKVMWKRLRWDEREIERVRQRLAVGIAGLNSVLSQIN